MLSTLAGTFAFSKACLLLPERQKFDGFEKDSAHI